MLHRIQLGKEESQGTSISYGIKATGGRGLPEEGGTQCDSGPVILASVAALLRCQRKVLDTILLWLG